MSNIGVLKDRRGKNGVILHPKDIASFNNELNFIVAEGAGKVEGFTDQSYENAGCFIAETNAEVIKYADIVIVHDEVNMSLHLSSEKIFLSDVDYHSHFASLIPMIGEPIDLFSFYGIVDKNSLENKLTKDYYLGFLKYFIGEPVSSDLIDTIASSKILNQGKVSNHKMIEMINMI